MKIFKNVLFFVITSFVVLFLALYLPSFDHKLISPAKAQSSTTNGYLTGYVWSENIGWISFSKDTNGNSEVTVDSNNNINGYAWSDNIGWIKFGGLSSGFPTGTSTVSSDAILTKSGITGWARACAVTVGGNCDFSNIATATTTGGSDGWISFSGTSGNGKPYGVTKNSSSNNFSGYAWGSDVGWVDFSGVSLSSQTPCLSNNTTINITDSGTIQAGGTPSKTLPGGVIYNSTNGFVTTSINTNGVVISYPATSSCPAYDVTLNLKKSVAVSPSVPIISNNTPLAITLRACRNQDLSGQCKDADGSIIVAKGGVLYLNLKIVGEDLDCSSSSPVSVFNSLSSQDLTLGSTTVKTDPIDSTQSFILNCSNSQGSVKKTIRAVVTSVKEF